MSKKYINENSTIDPWCKYNNCQAVVASKNALMQNYKKLEIVPRFFKVFVRKKSKFAVIGFNIYNQLSGSQMNQAHIIFKPRDIIKNPFLICKHFKNFTFNLGIYGKVYRALKKSIDIDYQFERDCLLRISPKILIVSSTIDPVQRLWIMAARDLEIVTVCIQHGVMSSLSPPEIKERNIVDYYFSYNKKQSKTIKSIIPMYKHRWLFDSEYFTLSPFQKNKITICLIGSDYERYGEVGIKNKKSLIDIYTKIVKAINSIHGPSFAHIYYKKHPSETDNFVVDAGIKSVKSINEDQVDIFFGVASTYLIHLASKNKCAIQVCAKHLISVDRYEDYGFCKSIDLSQIESSGLNFLLHNEVVIPKLVRKNFSNLIDDLIK